MRWDVLRVCLRRAPLVFPGLIVVVLCVHFAMTLVYLMPLNPIVLRLAPAVERYMAPWFIQDWRLFAPNPIDETRVLLVKCRLRQPNGAIVETTWADTSTPLWEAAARQRFSAAAWINRLQAQTLQTYLDQGVVLPALERHSTKQDAALNELVDEIRQAERVRRDLAPRVFARLGAAYCDSWYGADQTIATQMRLARLRFPRFSQRHLPDTESEMHSYTFGWQPYERVTAVKDTTDERLLP
ncbi:MAG TPA: DUF5819 family protein [Roseiflexaceae bacterium]|nr:DUF5819 family protein [Roseiflexaceae bacterium]